MASCAGVSRAGAVALRGELDLVDREDRRSRSRLEAVFFRTAAVTERVRCRCARPPKETRPELSKLIGAAPNDAELYSLRALEAEQQLDFTAAEADWKKIHRRRRGQGRGAAGSGRLLSSAALRSSEEFDALTLAAREPAPDSEKLLPSREQRPGKLTSG